MTDPLWNKALAAYQSGEREQALMLAEAVLSDAPADGQALRLVGQVALELGRFTQSRHAYERLLETDPSADGDAAVQTNYGNAQLRAGDAKAAAGAFQAALSLDPRFAPALLGWGAAARDLGRRDEAETAFRQACEADPENALAWANYALALIRRGALGPAEEAVQRSLKLNENSPMALAALARICRDQGRHDEALSLYRKALALEPNKAVHSAYLLGLSYAAGVEPETLYAAHREWARLHAPKPHPAAFPAAEANRPLRVGYVSADWREHPVAFFMEAVLRLHDRARVTPYVYSNMTGAGDPYTERLRALAGEWRDISAQDDDAAVATIRQDAIDVLIDLAGHTRGNRLGVFARRAAPVQATWLGYPATSGLDEMDVRLTDADADPPGQTDPWHSEILVRLPTGFLCFTPPSRPEITPLPAQSNGHVTFGSFNNAFKMSAACVRAWAGVLQAVPDAKLLLKARALDDVATQDAFRGHFRTAGVDPDRIAFLGRVAGHGGHLAAYGHVDIALDTLPYNGTTTTFEALWMGVPVVTLAGALHANRVGASILRRLDLGTLVAETAEAYAGIAARLASDISELAELRASLRGRMEASPLMDGAGFTRALEDALIDLRRTPAQSKP